MTITLQAVNELIASLESAGELSIKECKYLELAKAYQQLAAENALLKKSDPAPFSKLMMEALDVYQAGADEVPELAMLSAYKKLRDGLKTPATDAFLAEVRAQGVEMLRKHPAIKLCSLTHVCDEFAAQLRKGVRS